MDPKQPHVPAPSWRQNKSWSEGKAGKAGKAGQVTPFAWTQLNSIPREYFQGNKGDFFHLTWKNLEFLFLCRPGVHPKGHFGHFSKVSQLFRGLRGVKKIRNEGKPHLREWEKSVLGLLGEGQLFLGILFWKFLLPSRGYSCLKI